MGNIRSVFQREDPFGDRLYELLSEEAQEKLKNSEMGSFELKSEIENMIESVRKNPDSKIEHAIDKIIQTVQSQKSLRHERSSATFDKVHFCKLPEADLLIRFPFDFSEDITYFPLVVNGRFARLKHLFLYQALANLIKLKLITHHTHK